MRRGLTALAALLVVVAGIAWYAVGRSDEPRQPRAQRQVTLSQPGQILFADPARARLAAVSIKDPSGPRVVSGIGCLRFHAAAGIGVCLRAGEAVILDAGLREGHRFKLTGAPTRARVSASGRLVAWSSTRTSVLDTQTGKFYPDLAKFVLVKNGRRGRAPAAKLWGVTFLPDDNGFYATLSTGRKTYLAFGDLARRTMGTLRENVESPSLSPDGTRLAFIKRTRLYVLDLRTRREKPLSERAAVDDQASWLDDKTLMYHVGADIWSLPADGSGTPRRLISSAFSPVSVR